MSTLERLRQQLAGLLTSIREVSSPDWSSRQGALVKAIVIHTTESADGTADGVANYFKTSSVAVSSHYIIESIAAKGEQWTKVILCVPEWASAWTARSANRTTINYELVGYAHRRNAWAWLLTYRTQLETAAALVAEDCLQYDIPIQHGYPGILGHRDLAAWGFPNDHTDPGPDFPWDEFLKMVRRYIDQAGEPDVVKVNVKGQPRPVAPRLIPRWAWKLDKWLSTKPVDRGPRPVTPVPLPSWFWPWRRWVHGVYEHK